MININELSTRTGFSVVFIRKCLDKLGDILLPHTQHGEFNRLLFDNNAIVLFDKIKQLKEDGLSLPEIRRKLEKDLGTNSQTGSEKSEQTLEQGDTNSVTLQKFLDLHLQVNEEKDKRIKEQKEASEIIRELEKKNEQLSWTMKLLPEGKTPEQLKAEWEVDQKRKQEVAMIIGEMKNLSVIQFIKRKKLLARLEELMS